MSLFTFQTNATPPVLYPINAADYHAARLRLITAHPSFVLPDIHNFPDVDTSLFDGTNNTYALTSFKYIVYWISATSDLAAYDIWRPIFAPEEMRGIVQLTVDNSLLNGTPVTPPTGEKLYMISTHYGAGTTTSINSDYSASTLALFFKVMNACHFNAARTDINYPSSTGVPYHPAFSSFLQGLKDNGKKLFAAPSVSRYNTIPAAGVKNATQAEYIANYNKGKAEAILLANYCGSVLSHVQLSNEAENFYYNNGAGLGPVTHNPVPDLQTAPAAPTGAGNTGSPYRWASPSNNWAQVNYGMFLYFIAGMRDGYKSVNSALKIGCNFASNHYGLMQRVYSDVNLIWGWKFDFIGVDRYQNEEKSWPGLTISDTKAKFITTGLTTQIIITETGYNTTNTSTTINGVSYAKTGFCQYMYNTYADNADCGGLGFYEAFEEFKMRVGQGGEITVGWQDYNSQIFSDTVNAMALLGPPAA